MVKDIRPTGRSKERVVAPSHRRWSPRAMRLRAIDGQQMWIYAHNESQHSATAPKTTAAQRRTRRKIQQASRRRNRTR